MTLFLYDAQSYTTEQIEQIVRQHLGQGYDTQAGQLRSAAMYCPRIMPVNDFVAACVRCGVNPGTARNRFNEVRQMQRELGE